jgi:hypothetical protein
VFNDYQPSARARAMGNAFTAISDDANAVFYNPAGLQSSDLNVSIGMSQLNGQKFSELMTGSVALPLPLKLGTLGVGAQVFDVDYEETTLMAEQQFTLAHGFTLLQDIHSSVAMGWSATMYNLTMEGYDDDNAMGLNLSAKAMLHQRTSFGFAVTNINQPKLGANNAHSLPRKLAMGLAYLPYDGVTTSVELKKDFAKDTEFMGGVEVKLFEPFSLRAGVHQNPATWSCGAAFRIPLDILTLTSDFIALDYSFTQHTVLEPTHYLNVGYIFNKGK